MTSFVSHFATLRLLMLASLVALTACSGGPRKPPPDGIEGKLYTDTLKGDIRLFRFVVTLPERPVRPITQMGQPPQGGSGRRDRRDDQLEDIERQLENQQQLKEFCPNGFTVIERIAVLNELEIRGECKYGG